MDKVLQAAGATVGDLAAQDPKCCGAGYSITDASVVRRLTREILVMAKAVGRGLHRYRLPAVPAQP